MKLDTFDSSEYLLHIDQGSVRSPDSRYFLFLFILIFGDGAKNHKH